MLTFAVSSLLAFQVAFYYVQFVHLCASCRRRHFLCFASPKKRKQKKGDCGHRFGFAKLPSLHTVFRAGSQLAASPLRTCKPLFPEKPCSVRLCQQTDGKTDRFKGELTVFILLDVQGYLKQ